MPREVCVGDPLQVLTNRDTCPRAHLQKGSQSTPSGGPPEDALLSDLGTCSCLSYSSLWFFSGKDWRHVRHTSRDKR